MKPFSVPLHFVARLASRLSPWRFRRRAVLDERQRATWGMTIGLQAALFTLLLLRWHPVGARLEYDSLDMWFAMRHAPPSGRVVILAVDDRTLRRWNDRPFDADALGRLLRELKKAGVRAVALDWPALDQRAHALSPRQRADFAATLRDTGNVYLPLNSRAASGDVVRYFERLSPLPNEWTKAAAGIGHDAFGLDWSGRPRVAYPILNNGNIQIPSLAAATAGGFLDGQNAPQSHLQINDFEDGVLLDFPSNRAQSTADATAEPPRVFRTISVVDALDNPILLRSLRDSCIVIGPTARGLTTKSQTPQGDSITPVELQAVAIDNLLSGEPIEQAPEAWLWLLSVLPCVIVGGFVASRPPAWSAVVTLLSLATVFTLSAGLFAQNLWFDITAPWLGIGLTYMTGVIGRARRDTREATRVVSTIDAITQVSGVIAMQDDKSALLERSLRWILDVMQAEAGAAWLFDDERNGLRLAAATGGAWTPREIALGEGIAGTVAQNDAPILSNDLARDAHFRGEIDGVAGVAARSMLCLPLRAHGQAQGVIAIFNRRDGAPFLPADIELLHAVASQSAVLLENADLMARLNQRVAHSEGELAVTNRRLEAERNLLDTVLQSMTDGVVVTDRDGRIRLVNAAAMTLLIELQDARDLTLNRALPDYTPQINGAATILTRGDMDAPRFIEAHSAPLPLVEGKHGGLVTVFADVTEERYIEQAKSDFVSFVAHEMRSPLTTIAGFSSMLQRAELQSPVATIPNGNGNSGTLASPLGPSATQRARYLGLIRDESDRLTRLINSLLDVARIEAGRDVELQREDLDFSLVAQGAIETQRGYSSRHNIIAEIASDLPPVWADGDKVTQILINLLSNALKYSPGGTVVLSARRMEPNDPYLEVRVRDEGPGIARDEQSKLFQRFGRAHYPVGPGEHAKPTGTGLGLFLTKHLVELHGGEISVQSDCGAGTTFLFTLPFVSQSN